MTEVRRLIYAINKFLKSEISEGKLSSDKVEGVEIGIQCLEAAYDLGSTEPSLDVPFTLPDIFQKHLYDHQNEPTDEDKAAAETFKTEGNNYMDLQDFEDAVISYTKAIRLDPKNPKYYGNRAAAFNKLGKYGGAIRDSQLALQYDPSYSKAYCRLGQAHANMNQNWREAVACYKRAVELEPHNERYQELLKVAEDVLRSQNVGPANPTNEAASNFSNTNFRLEDQESVLEGLVDVLLREIGVGAETMVQEVIDMARQRVNHSGDPRGAGPSNSDTTNF